MRYIYIGGGIAAVAIAILLSFTLSSNAEVLEVDAFRDQADVVGFYRVTLKNNSDEDITNIVVDFGNHEVKIPKLAAKQSIIISPTEEVTSNYIIVRADPDIFIEKEFRSAPRMPGMIGGMG
ncbi:MAG: hypothetical protein KatS3mg003_2198 [Candidatus Nitrosocaldaceae archaeon]|nr:MAG: hypothetical protein KatS3mg003_0008 [Candidatus Nitrosocaldaceae archaeon]GIU72719.1 MAG: hypothetical protein KatS3mg003_2198 [Candidatus Nitrosocaldaceae archaeon]